MREKTVERKVIKIVMGFIGISVSVFIIANICTYAIAEKNIIDYFCSKEEKEIVWDMLWKDGKQSVVVEDYTITLEEYLYDEKGQEGYVVFSVRREGYDMREEFGRDYEPGESENTFGGEIDNVFGGEGRFAFELLVNGSGTKGYKCRYKKEKDVMYVYYEFDVNVNHGFDGEILLCDKENGGEYWKVEEEAIYKFKLEKSVGYKMYEIDTGENIYHMYVTPTEVKIIGKTPIKQIYDVVLHFDNMEKIHVVEHERLINGEYYTKGGGGRGYHYIMKLSEIINVNDLKNIEVNWENIKQLSDKDVEEVEKEYTEFYKEQLKNEENK